jgi:outer membrane biosynthesis protein TonB
MTARLSLTLVTILALATPTLATAQTTDPTSGYTPTLSTGTSTTPPTKPDPKPKPTPTPAPENNALPKTGAGTNPPTAQTAPATATNPSTGTTPSKLAYTGSDVLLLGLVGLLALGGGVALMRSSRRA